MRGVFLFLFLCLPLLLTAQQTDKPFYKLLKKNKSLKPVLKKVQNYRIQIIYTSFSDEYPKGKTSYFNYNPDLYFYPASSVKLPAALLALEKLNYLHIKREEIYSSHSLIEGYSSVLKVDNNEKRAPSISDYIRKIFLFSDNDAFNRLYDFIGMEEFNTILNEKGYKNSRFNHRLSISLSPIQNQQTPSISLGENYLQKANSAKHSYPANQEILLGEKYYSNGNLVNEPMNFTLKNQFDLLDQHLMLKALFFPKSINSNFGFSLSHSDLGFLKKSMHLLPRNAETYKKDIPDGYSKFLMFGDTKKNIPENLKIYNKVGGAYGFLSDNAYFEDSLAGIHFILSAVIYCNENQTLNDDHYEYDEIGLPFLGELGRYIYKYEKELRKEQ